MPAPRPEWPIRAGSARDGPPELLQRVGQAFHETDRIGRIGLEHAGLIQKELAGEDINEGEIMKAALGGMALAVAE